MKLVFIGFVLGLLVALIGAKALGEGHETLQSPPHHHRRSAKTEDDRPAAHGPGRASDDAIDLLRRLTRQAATGSNGGKDTPGGGSNKGIHYFTISHNIRIPYWDWDLE